MERDYYSDYRIVNVALGAWLFVSAFLWPHAVPEMVNAALVGIGIAVIGYLGTKAPMLRFLNTALAIWLFISAFVLPAVSWGTGPNNALVALSVFLLSFVGSYPQRKHTAARGT